jgi:C4-dicarboxylate-specific signal transduction histidine kinase
VSARYERSDRWIEALSTVRLLKSADQLQKAVLNLLLNGLDACAGQPDARVEVVLQESTTATELRVIDNGCGMSAALVSRMFEPFFTTKPQGVSMGLALVRRIVEAHGGRVDAQLRGEGGMVVCIQRPREIAEQ